MSVRTVLFNAEGHDREVELREVPAGQLAENQLLWVDIRNAEEDEIERTGELFDLDPACVRDLVRVHHRPELRSYGEYFHLQVIGVARKDDRDEPVHLDMVAGNNYVITVQQEDLKLLENFDEQVRGDSKIGSLSFASFVAALLDLHIDSYYRALGLIEDQVDRFDETALSGHLNTQTEISFLVGMRRWVRHLRRLLLPHREVYGRLARPDFAQFFDDATIAYIESLNDRLERTIDAVENARDLVFGSFDILMAQNAENTNDIVRVLTVVTVAAAIAGVLAGVLGMNFTTGLFDTGDLGFFLAVGGMGLSSAVILTVARLRKWI